MSPFKREKQLTSCDYETRRLFLAHKAILSVTADY